MVQEKKPPSQLKPKSLKINEILVCFSNIPYDTKYMSLKSREACELAEDLEP